MTYKRLSRIGETFSIPPIWLCGPKREFFNTHIPFTLIIHEKGEWTAQACVIALFSTAILPRRRISSFLGHQKVHAMEEPAEQGLPQDDNRQRGRWRIRWVFVILVLVVFVGDRAINGNRGEMYHQRLLKESRAIPQFPASSLVAAYDHFSRWNSHKALVGSSYNTTQSFSKIRNFYDGQMESLGWHVVEGKLDGVQYCKGELGADLEYAKTNEYSYSLNLTWGTNKCK